MPEKSFKEYLLDGMFENYIRTGTTLHTFLSKKGIDVSVRAAQRYIKGDYIPEFENARRILDALNVEVSDDDLREVVNNSDATFRKKRRIHKEVSLKVRNLSDKLKADEEIMAAFEERFHKSQNNKKPRFSAYIEELIKADIDRHILDQ